jgi:hypothetical protein
VVLYPSTASREVREAYNRLEAELFKLKEHRPSLRIVDRQHLPAVIREQQFQLRGLVSEETAVRLGRILGVEAAVVYQIEGPSFRDIVHARFSGVVPPVVITTKVILVESAEVVFHNVVTSPVAATAEAPSMEAHAALQRAVARTAMDLRFAFQ